MNKEEKGLTERFVEAKNALNQKYGGQLDSLEYSRELANVKQKFYRERKKLKKEPKELTPSASIPFNEGDLSAFNDRIEQSVIKAYLADIRKTSKQIAEELGGGVSSQLVTSILDRPDVKELAKRLIWGDISLACELAIRDGAARKDPAWVKIAHDYGYVTKGTGAECSGCHPEPLKDPEAERALEILGNWLCDPSQDSVTIDRTMLKALSV